MDQGNLVGLSAAFVVIGFFNALRLINTVRGVLFLRRYYER